MVKRQQQRGQAMVELLIVAGFVLIPLFLAIPLLGKYLDVRASAVQTARYAAWERTVWYGGNAASEMGWFGANKRWQANAKSDEQIRREIGVRHLSDPNGNDAFYNITGSVTGESKALWQDRNGGKLLASYDDVSASIDKRKAPGTLNVVLDPIANFAATLGPFVLEMKGNYAATVTMQVKDIDYDHFLLKNSTANFSETNVLLANGWNADGPDDRNKTSVKQQVKGLVPTSLLAAEIKGVKIIDYVLGALSVFLPEASKLEPGKIEPDIVPADRLK